MYQGDHLPEKPAECQAADLTALRKYYPEEVWSLKLTDPKC